ncbi:hypothetical protein [Sulfitobacter guttiformis]|uniref:Lipoprotein n=1 Tax=Sulfitobacter guttiformis TaxID=74349 RepID=A0A420DTN0_9RHOB|nr:hypothetical protein [Sulfitobacter guttiformis]KIN71054.1 hypothetical protein Z949_210 [Sulfitobacter guttiformis KCTC 32187]RKE97538.1 hypothetical protein C8N30_2149 [Sulfitobacter guttiformis]
MKLKSKSSAFGALLLLAACGGGGAAVGVAGISSLGSGFVQMFAAAPNSDPVDAQAVNITAVSLTAAPFNP